MDKNIKLGRVFEDSLKELSDQELDVFISTTERYLVDFPEPEILKGKSRVRSYLAKAINHRNERNMSKK